MSNCRYFGINGIRGHVGDTPITPDSVFKLGQAAGKVLAHHSFRKVTVGRDTRTSGYMLKSALEAGLAATGFSTLFTGPMSAPAVAYLACTFRVEAGIVISASHSPFYDNGIKFFSTDSVKLPDAIEETIEAEMEKEIGCVGSVEPDKASRITDAVGRHTEFCKATSSNELSLSELKIVVDCANGATHHIAPSVLRELGADVIATGCELNDVNINVEVRATDVHTLQARVLAKKADLGVTFDGDGDCVIMIDREGNKADGDQIMCIIACEDPHQGRLRGSTVDALMNNVGFKLVPKQLGTPFVRAKVGNCYVLEKMQERGWHIGAENPGHMILLDKITTGDGIVADSQILAAMARSHMSLYDPCSGMKIFPQILVNVRYIAGGGNPLGHESAKTVTAEVEAVLGSHRHALLYKSGTEPLTRAMVEDEDEAQITKFVYRIVDAVKTVQSVR